jgi:uncharacterized membrane protein
LAIAKKIQRFLCNVHRKILLEESMPARSRLQGALASGFAGSWRIAGNPQITTSLLTDRRRTTRNWMWRRICVMDSHVLINNQRPRGQRCYLWGILFPVQYLLTVRRDRQHPFLRFHCMQYLLLFALLIPLAIWNDKHVSNIASIAFVVLLIGWLVAMIQAGRRKMFKLPVLGRIAERLASGTKSSSE